MTFGQRIRALRWDAGLTQENLAELLSISPQAVSRWETDAAMPDISLLPPLCNLFGVSADHLLGMETYEKDLRRAEFDEAFRDYWKHDDKEKKLADHALFELLMRLREIGGPEAYDAVEQIVSLLFPDGHLGLYHNTLQYNAVHKAFRLCGAQRWEDAIEALRTARRHAEAMTKLCADFGGRKFRCTAKLFDMLEVDVPVPETGVTDLDNFLRCLDNNRCFDPLRGRADFQSLASPRCGS